MSADTRFRYSIFIGLVVIVGLCVAAYFFSPKGENQMSAILLSTPYTKTAQS